MGLRGFESHSFRHMRRPLVCVPRSRRVQLRNIRHNRQVRDLPRVEPHIPPGRVQTSFDPGGEGGSALWGWALMDHAEIETVRWLLHNARSLPRWAIACLPQLSPVSLDDPWIVVDGRDLDENEDVPRQATVDGLSRTLSTRAIVAVLDNVVQLDAPTDADVLDALNYFILAECILLLRV